MTRHYYAKDNIAATLCGALVDRRNLIRLTVTNVDCDECLMILEGGDPEPLEESLYDTVAEWLTVWEAAEREGRCDGILGSEWISSLVRLVNTSPEQRIDWLSHTQRWKQDHVHFYHHEGRWLTESEGVFG